MTGPSSTYATRWKRSVDLAGSGLLLVVLSPIYATCAVLILLTSGRPVHFHQERAGQDGRTFRVHKFRTMLVGTEGKSGNYPTAAMVTPVGHVLRRWSLDELPQLVNIVRGEMSFVGPRPALSSQVQRYSAQQRGRLAVRPGLTGLAQVRHRNSAPWSRRIETDLEYVRNVSLRHDVAIILMTVPKALKGEGQIMGQTAAEVDDLGTCLPPGASRAD